MIANSYEMEARINSIALNFLVIDAIGFFQPRRFAKTPPEGHVHLGAHPQSARVTAPLSQKARFLFRRKADPWEASNRWRASHPMEHECHESVSNKNRRCAPHLRESIASDGPTVAEELQDTLDRSCVIRLIGVMHFFPPDPNGNEGIIIGVAGEKKDGLFHWHAREPRLVAREARGSILVFIKRYSFLARILGHDPGEAAYLRNIAL